MSDVCAVMLNCGTHDEGQNRRQVNVARRLLAERLLERRLGCLGQRPVPLRRADLLDGVERPA